MTELNIFEENGQLLADSREVAQTIQIRHGDLLEKINGYVKYLTNGEFRSLDFFIESTYPDSKGEIRPCYLITKKGCDMIANKLTGRKGVLFTAAYVEGFNKMKEFIEKSQTIGDNVSFPDFVKSLEIVADMLRYNEASKVAMLHQAYKSFGLPTGFLPNYVESREKHAATTLLKRNQAPFNTRKFNILMESAGLLEHKERPSRSKGSKLFWSLTKSGMEFGENLVSESNPRETQPLYYTDLFPKLLEILSEKIK